MYKNYKRTDSLARMNLVIWKWEGTQEEASCDVTGRNAVSRHAILPGEPGCPESACGIFTYIFVHLG